MRKFRRNWLVVLLFFLLSGCYLPNQFEAVIEIAQNGNYSVSYQGILTYAPMVEEIRAGKLTPAQQEEKRKILERDLKRDSGFKELVYIGNGSFKVKYRHNDRIDGTHMYTFTRRNAAIFTVRTDKKGVTSISGASLAPEHEQRIIKAGIQMMGELKVITDVSTILENNATQAGENMGYKIFVWKINSPTAPTPKLTLRLK